MTDIKRLVVTGGFGQIGRSMTFGVRTDRTEIDVTDYDNVVDGLRQLRATAVLNLASVDLRPSQADPAAAFQVNVAGTYNVARAAEKLGLPMILVTTGAIFNGSYGSAFDETATPDPLCVYAKSKHMAELIVQTMVPKHLIVRTGWLFALNVAPRKKFVELVMVAAEENQPIKATNDQSGSPTYTPDFVDALKAAIGEDRRGILHIVNYGIATAVEIADAVCTAMGRKSVVERTSFRDFMDGIPRSESEGLSSRYVKLRPWTEALVEYVRKATSFDRPS